MHKTATSPDDQSEFYSVDGKQISDFWLGAIQCHWLIKSFYSGYIVIGFAPTHAFPSHHRVDVDRKQNGSTVKIEYFG